MVNMILGGGPILLSIMIALTEILNWPRKMHYVWAGVALAWGMIMLLM